MSEHAELMNLFLSEFLSRRFMWRTMKPCYMAHLSNFYSDQIRTFCQQVLIDQGVSFGEAKVADLPFDQILIEDSHLTYMMSGRYPIFLSSYGARNYWVAYLLKLGILSKQPGANESVNKDRSLQK